MVAYIVPMCIAAPGRVVSVRDKSITVDYGHGIRRDAFTAEYTVRVDDYVLVQMGIVVTVLQPEEAKKASQEWDTCVR